MEKGKSKVMFRMDENNSSANSGLTDSDFTEAEINAFRAGKGKGERQNKAQHEGTPGRMAAHPIVWRIGGPALCGSAAYWMVKHVRIP